MRENDGRKLDHATLEVIRRRAVDRVHLGVHPVSVAESLGLDKSTVYKWLAAERRGGVEALAAKPIPGRPMKLDGDQIQKVYEWVAGGDPRQQTFGFGLWTRDLVAELVWKRFRVRLSKWSVGRLLHRLGLSPQRPLYRAWQQDPVRVDQWKREEYPRVAAYAKTIGAVVYFGDEAGVRSDYHAGTTWAVVGKTPVVEATGARFSINMMSAVTVKGQLRFQIVDSTVTAPVFIEFCKRLLTDSGRPVILIVDGHPVHRSKKLKEWVQSTGGQFQIYHFPGYSPQLNPDEWVWKHIKHDQIGRRQARDRDELTRIAASALHRLQKLPTTIQGFFNDPDLAYIHHAHLGVSTT